MSTEKGEKRPADNDEKDEDKPDSDSDSEGWVGPLPSEAAAPPTKKRLVLEYESVYLENLPLCETYEKSYMHRDTITHILVTKTEFIVTASCDGHVKFWKKVESGIEFVKHFRSHLEAICDMRANSNGLLLCTASIDKTVKVFDVINFDMINMFKTTYVPRRLEWIHSPREPIAALAVTDADSSKVYIYDGKGTGNPIKVLDRLHMTPVTTIRYNPIHDLVVSGERSGMMEYWGTASVDFQLPKCVSFTSKLDTDLFTFAKHKTYAIDLSFSPDGEKFAAVAADRYVRVFRTLTGKLMLVLDESLARVSELQQKQQQLPHMEFGRRMAGERDLDKSDAVHLSNVLFDSSGYFLLYGTMLGVKVVNLHTRRVIKLLGKSENMRPLQIALFQGAARRSKAAVTIELEASDNPAMEAVRPDPTLFCTTAKKNRFYLFSRRPAEDSESDRDVFNEKPSKEDIVSATESSGLQRLAENVILHTEMGDVHLQLFLKEAPKACENFCIHARNGYYNGHIFHRVIKGFMVQTGDPTGTGSGGESVWGGEFEDEFHPNARHDKPYTVSMANAGPNSNGSQFFITVAPTPWLDNKHTVFGRVNRGMEVVLNISNAKTNPKTNKPHDDIRMLSVALK